MVGRSVLVVEACLADDNPVSLAELTARTGLPKQTVRRIADQMVTHDLLKRTPRGYLAGHALVDFGARAAQQHRRWTDLIPFVADLHARTGAAVWVVDASTHHESWPVLATVYGSQAAASGYADTWPRNPKDPAILATALGRLAFAHHPERAYELVRAGPQRLTPYTDVSPARILTGIERARANNESYEHDGVVSGWSCLAVTVAENGSPGARSAILGVVSPTTRFRLGALLSAAHSTAAAIADAQKLAGPSRTTEGRSTTTPQS